MIRVGYTAMTEYKGYYIEHDLYNQEEFTVQYGGDDVFFETIDKAKAFIDKITKED